MNTKAQNNSKTKLRRNKGARLQASVKVYNTK